ncbi:dimethyladenosine transferase [Ruminiclostridium papyrosolvens DSM 2782]|uniref:Ribosomal RNA small subunit methyltransferase A n=1 Tax=Ruminiclostridium papyrosolvens DSM 2782 TaxID=588581 RepID=F1TCY0_9FIRM|nr:16S rRNA (adenine(1518)-N(6)/adenine(1519)-N(6))-dimethyltransferase RsmA [Ruminiclostridium papyrosolvens]EGD47847.1 dimethyladenosine transferase [Ruminiclostridium papyrosolvens DSM 2782]WES34561.1 16S rRNA (adenine(1518)-N(6)/adenine(1519)-N(6))-dimethyltransferase RsmA [Ruminiclostridium papyrosolvens DSM 2782]
MIKNNTSEIIKKHGLKLTKALGQNFLTDFGVVQRIVDASDIDKDTLAIEIGPGVGSMTRELAERSAGVAAIEIDKRLIPALNDNLSDYSNVSIINEDIMKADIDAIIKKYKELYNAKSVKVVANLPYYITTPIIMRFLEEVKGVDKMVFMVQKEVAERMVSGPGTKDYGALSVAVQFYSNPKIVFDVPPHCFIPQPEVHSTIIGLDILSEPPVEVADKNLYFKIVKASFGQRRKTLVNALSNSGFFNKNKEQIKQIIAEMGLNENIRGEVLTVAQFAQLTNLIIK